MSSYNGSLTNFLKHWSSVSDRDSQFIVAQAAQNQGDDKYDFLGNGVYNGCATLDASSWSMCKVSTTISCFAKKLSLFIV